MGWCHKFPRGTKLAIVERHLYDMFSVNFEKLIITICRLLTVLLKLFRSSTDLQLQSTVFLKQFLCFSYVREHFRIIFSCKFHSKLKLLICIIEKYWYFYQGLRNVLPQDCLLL